MDDARPECSPAKMLRVRRWEQRLAVAFVTTLMLIALLAAMIHRIVYTKWRMTNGDRAMFVGSAAGLCLAMAGVVIARRRYRSTRAKALAFVRRMRIRPAGDEGQMSRMRSEDQIITHRFRAAPGIALLSCRDSRCTA